MEKIMKIQINFQMYGHPFEMYEHENHGILKGTPQGHPAQQIAGLIKGLLTTMIP